MSRRAVECVRCHRVRPHAGRGLCDACHSLLRYHDDLADYPPVRNRWRGPELVVEVEFMLGCGESAHTVADRLGLAASSVERSLYRQGRPDLARQFGRGNKVA